MKKRMTLLEKLTKKYNFTAYLASENNYSEKDLKTKKFTLAFQPTKEVFKINTRKTLKT